MLTCITKWWFRGKRYSSLQRSLEQARISTPPDDYVKMTVLTTVVGAGVGIFVGAILSILLFGSPSIPVLIISMVVGGLAIAGLVYAGWMGYPSIQAGSISGNIDTLLPQSTAYMYALSSGGLGLTEILKSLAEREEEYGEVAREAKRIIHNVEYFRVDIRSATTKVAESTPSRKLRRMLESMAEVVQMGGNLSDFFSDKYKELHDDAIHRQRSFLETLGILAELYVIVFVVTPTVFLTLFVVGGMIGMFSMGGIGILICMGYPFITIGLLVVLNAITKSMPKRKFVGKAVLTAKRKKSARTAKKRRYGFDLWRLLMGEPMYVLVGSVPVAVVYLTLTFFLVGTLGMFDMLAAFTVATLPFVILYEYRERKISDIEERIPDFLRAISSASTSGLPLPRAIKMMSTEHLGAIGPYIRRMQNNIEWGMPMSDAISEFANDTQSSDVWRTVTLIQKVSESGGNTAKVADIAEDEITTSRNMARERKSNMFTYLLIVYIGFAVLLFTVYMINTSIFAYVAPLSTTLGAQTGTTFNTVEATNLLFNTSMVLSLCSGIVAGTISTGKIQSGVKHSLILAILTYLTFAVFIIPQV